MAKRAKSSKSNITIHGIEQAILVIRGQRVMLDSELAELYDVTVAALNQAVNRNAGGCGG